MSPTLKLRELGLNGKEVAVYLALLKNGRRTPAALSQITKINRATVYSVAKNLQSKGLIAEDISGRSRYFLPLPPKNLNQIIDRPRRELEEKEKLVKDVIEELHQLTSEQEYPVPKIRFIQESDLKDFLFDNTRKWQQNILHGDGIWWGFQDHSFAEYYKEWIHFAWTTPEGRNPKHSARIITNTANIEKKLKTTYLKEKRNMRSLRGENLTSTVWVAGEYIVMIATKHHPFYLVEIHDVLLAHNMREMFKKLWEQTREIV
jgi:sugar-specific transcriptional regulator TrmB